MIDLLLAAVPFEGEALPVTPGRISPVTVYFSLEDGLQVLTFFSHVFSDGIEFATVESCTDGSGADLDPLGELTAVLSRVDREANRRQEEPTEQ
jgi:hypothetical protein